MIETFGIKFVSPVFNVSIQISVGDKPFFANIANLTAISLDAVWSKQIDTDYLRSAKHKQTNKQT